MDLTITTGIDNTMSIDVDTTQVRTKRTGLIKVSRNVDDMRPTPVSPRAHIANDPDQPEWPQFRIATGDLVGIIIAIVMAVPPILMLGWIIFGGLS